MPTFGIYEVSSVEKYHQVYLNTGRVLKVAFYATSVVEGKPTIFALYSFHPKRYQICGLGVH